MRRLTVSAFSLAVAVSLGAGQLPAREPGVTGTSILVGIEGPTGAFSSDEENLGMRLVVQVTNDGGGIHGRKLVERGYARAGGAAIADAVANVKRLVEQDGVFLLFNHGGPAAVSIAPYAMQRGVPYLFPHTALLTADADRYVFTSYPRYLGESQVMLRDLAVTRHLTRIGIIYDENEYGRFFLDRLTEYASRFGYVVAGARGLRDRTPADVTSDLAALRTFSPDAIILALYPEQAQRVMDAKARLDWRSVRMVATGPLTDEQYLNVAGGYAEGTLGFCYYPDPNTSSEPGIVEYRRLMERYYPGHALNRYSLYGYVFGNLLVEGVRRAGENLTRDRFIDAMESIRDWVTGGIMPPVSFSMANHHAQRAGFICELQDGRFRALGGWIEP
jgi:ABC-type branched-subunit amino acid transport system substrate-binding protein